MANKLAAWIDTRSSRNTLVIGIVAGTVLASGLWSGGLAFSGYREKAEAEATYYRLKSLSEAMNALNSTTSKSSRLDDPHKRLERKLDDMTSFYGSGVRCRDY